MTTHLRGRRAVLVIVAVLALVLAATACADGGTELAAGASETAPDVSVGEGSGGEEPGGEESGGAAPATGDAHGVEVTGERGAEPVITLTDGVEPPTELVVVDLAEGDGEEIPPDATVTVDYVGVSWLNDGEEFDSSFDRGEPISFPLDGVIQGWGEGIPGMRVGGRRLLIIPPDLAYGDQPPTDAIAPGDTLVFVVDAVGIVPPVEPVEPTDDTMGVEVGGEPGAAPQITLPDAEPPAELVVVDLVEGDGAEVPPGATVTTHYTGVSWLNGGTEFDSSFGRGEPATFPLDGVIPGWTQGIPGMRVGGRRLLIIPPDLAYGDQPPTDAIAPGDTLVFVIDLTDVQ